MYNNVFLFNEDINKPIVIFGTGNNAKRAYFTLLNMGIPIEAFADRNNEMIGERLYGKTVIEENSLVEKPCSVIIASKDWQDIVSRLESKGVNNIFIMNMYSDYSAAVEL